MASLLRGSALITGAGSGIGQYTAYALAQHGIRQLAICDINASSLETTSAQLRKSHKDLEILPLEMDVANEGSVRSAFRKTVDRFERLDVTVNNAGIGGAPTPTHETELSKWDKVIDVNVKGVWLCQREAIRYMLKQQALDAGPRGSRGVIVNVASMLGTVASSPGTPACAYTSSKHAVMGKHDIDIQLRDSTLRPRLGMTKTDAVMYASQGIRINAICPGYVGTPLLKAATGSGVMAAEVAKVPQQRLGEMEEIADAITFLASPMSSFMAGVGLVVDGGYTAQ